MLCLVVQTGYAQMVTVLPSNGTYSSQSSPQGSLRQQRNFYLLTAAEMQAAGLAGGTTVNSIGFNLAYPQNINTKGSMRVFLQNTADVVSRNDTAWTVATNVSTNRLALSLLGMGNYEWQVKANCGTSSPFVSSVIFSTANAAGCNMPTSLNTTLVTTTSAQFNWTAPTSTVTKYYVEYSRQDTITWITDSTANNFYAVTGLSPDKNYQWRIRTICGSLFSDLEGSTFTTDNIAACASPGSLLASGITDTLAQVSWTAVTGATFYSLQFRRLGTPQWLNANAVSNSFTINFGLDPGTTYEWRVRTVCNGGVASGSFVAGSNFTTMGTTVCYATDNLVADSISTSAAVLTWSPVTGATSYEVRYRLKESISWANVVAGMDTVHNDSLVVPNLAGAYDISFVNGNAFTYTGNGLYVAWEYSKDTGTLSLTNITVSTDAGSVLTDVNGQDSIVYLRSFAANANGIDPPTLLTSTRSRPETRLGSTQLGDSVSVSAVFALGKIAPAYTVNPITAIISNHSSISRDITATLRVKNAQGVQRYTADSIISIGAGSTGQVNFNGWLPSVHETDSLIISIPAETGENVLNNNRQFYLQQVNASLVSHADKTAPLTEAGFGTGSGLVLAKHFLNGCANVNAANIYLTGSAKGNEVYAVLLNSTGALVSQSENYTVADDAINSYHSFLFSTPAALQNEAYYIGLAQTSDGFVYNPVGVQWEGPYTRDSAYFRNKLSADSLWEQKLPGRLMIEASIVPGSSSVSIAGKLSLCTGATNILTATKVNARYANKVLGFSSEQSGSAFGTVQALGLPDVYPSVGLSAKAWTSATAQGGREYITLQFPGASAINFIDIYETYNAGAIDSVYVKNPGTGNYVSVFSGTADSIGAEAPNKKRLSFTLTTFPVSEVRIALNSGRTSGFNSIDAVAIGVISNPGGFDSYLWSPGGETTATKSVNSPGVYTVTVSSTGGCTGTDSVTVFTPTSTAPIITASGPLGFCAGGSVILTSDKLTGNTWSTGATTRQIIVNTAGSFTVSHDDGSGCGTSISAAKVTTINAAPVAAITGELGICVGTPTTLDAGVHSSYLWSTGATTRTISVLSPGTYNVSVTNASGCTSTASANTFYTTIPAPTITGNLNFCPGGSTVLDAGDGYSSYAWSTGATSRIITVSNGTTIALLVGKPNGCTSASSVVTALFTKPVPEITGNDGFCTGGNTTLSASTNYNGYLWSTGAIASSINVNTTGSYSLTVTDANGCTGTTARSIVTYPTPVPFISGTLSFCAGTATTLNAGTGYSSYLWSTGATTATIPVSTVGNFSVAVTNSYGCSASAYASTTQTGAIPATPGPITGAAVAVCSSNGKIYSITDVANAAYYVWTVPSGMTIASGQGTTAISTNFASSFAGGTILVAAANACGRSVSITPREFYVKGTADKPGAITGQTLGLCASSGIIYSISPVALATSYTWTVPAGASITQGQNTLSIKVSFPAGFSFGNVCVRANNGCGSSVASCLQVSGKSPTPGPIAGRISVCGNEKNLAYTIDPVPGATSYIWTVPVNAVLSSGQGSRRIVLKMGPNSGVLTVKAVSSCGTSDARSLDIATVACLTSGTITTSMPQLRPVPEIVSSYGGFTTVGNLGIEWTMGEPRVESETGNNFLFSQGFHQPLIYLPLEAQIATWADDLKIKVFPNPVTSILNVQMESTRGRMLYLEITDVNMRVLQRRQVFSLEQQPAQINMSGQVAGSYFLVVRNSKGDLVKTIKLVKLN